MKHIVVAALGGLFVCSPAQAINSAQLQRLIDRQRELSEHKKITPAEEKHNIDLYVDAYWETHPRTWSQWFFNDLPPGVHLSALQGGPVATAAFFADFAKGPVKVGYGSFGESASDFQDQQLLDPYAIASVRYYSYGRDINDEVLLAESFDVASNFLTSLTLQGFEPVIHAVPYDSSGNRIIILDGDGENITDAFALVLGVPEPASWAMMIAGFGLAGLALRGRATKVRVSFA